MGSRRTLGDRAERCAYRFLAGHGLSLVSQNFQRRGGEIDLIMMDGDQLVFVEVRFRRTPQFSAPETTVDIHKQRKIIRTAAHFLSRNGKLANHTVRFDVVGVEGSGDMKCRWIKDAFRPNDAAL